MKPDFSLLSMSHFRRYLTQVNSDGSHYHMPGTGQALHRLYIISFNPNNSPVKDIVFHRQLMRLIVKGKVACPRPHS